MSKVYKGYELMKLVSEGKLNLKQKVNTLSLDYKNCTIDFVLKDSAFNVMDLDFELIEDEIDINNIKDLYINDKTIGEDEIEFWTGRKLDIVLGNRINALIKWAKQADKEIKSIKEK